MDKVTDSDNKSYPSIYRRIRLTFGVMSLVMIVLFWLLIYGAENSLEKLSLENWLEKEAILYKTNYKQYGLKAPLPNELEFDSFWSEQSTPGWLLRFQKPGFYEFLLDKEDKHFIVFEHPSGKGLMYIVFHRDADDYLDEYELLLHQQTALLGGLFLFSIVGYCIYMSRIFSAPLTKIEKNISQMPPDQPMFAVSTQFRETRHIEQTLLKSKKDIEGFFQREKEFSRFASHELRTPIMIIQGSVEILNHLAQDSLIAEKAIGRIASATEDMRVLTEAFLLLGKAKIEPRYFAHHSLLDLLNQQLEKLAPIFAKQNATYLLKEENSQQVFAPESFINIVINNLIKNAFSYSLGDIELTLVNAELIVVNRHEGNHIYNAGYGCGIAIVARICERMGWQFSTYNDGILFEAKVRFG